MKTRFLLAVTVALVVASSAGAASARPGSSSGAKCHGSVSIGVITGLSGPIASSGIAQLQGALTAAALANRQGGVNGTCVKISSADSQYLPANTVSAFQKMVSVDHIQAFLIGGSAAVLATAPQATQNHIVIVNTGGAGANLAGISPYEFNTIELGTLDVGALANYMWAKGIRKIALAYVSNATGQPNAQLMQSYWQSRKGTVVANVNWQPYAVDMSSQVAIVKQSGAQGVFLNGQPAENAYFVKELRAAGSNIPVFGNIAIPSQEMLSIAGSAANGAVYVLSHLNITTPDAPTKAFLDYERTHFGQATVTAPLNELILNALAFDGLNVMIDAMQQLGSKPLTGANIKSEIEKIGTFKNQITGAITFKPDHTVAKILDLGMIQNGKEVKLESVKAGG